MSRAYFNEYDPFAAAWLRELMADGLIAPGDVDERSIVDVRPADLDGYDQCHFFAGIGVWSLALRSAGWPDDRPIWTASCPCQPFSAAGKGGGFADERHLWPDLLWLIRQCRPAIVIGEQVSSDDGLAWLDVVQADLDQAGYTSGALDTCAAGFGAPHIRQRLYWVAHANDARLEGWRGVRERAEERTAGARGVDGGLADAGSARAWRDAGAAGGARSEGESAGGGRGQHAAERVGDNGPTDRPGPTNGLWRDADWLGCRDGKWRPVAPGTFPLAATGTVVNRVGTLRGAGNALNVAQAQAFIEAIGAIMNHSPNPATRHEACPNRGDCVSETEGSV